MLTVLTTSSMAVTVVAVLAPEAAPAIGVDATRIGTYTAIVYVFATLSGAVTGPLVDRFGAIRVCQTTMALAALAMLCFAQASIAWALASAVVLGCAYGPFNPASAHVLWRLSTPRWRPLVFSIKQTGVPLGGALTGALIPAIVVWSDWQSGALTVGAVALVMMVLLQGLRAGIDADRGAPIQLDAGRLLEPVRLALMEPRLRGYTLTAFAYAGCQLSVMSFMVVFLTRAVDMSLVLAGSVFACLQAGGFAGRLVWGGVASRLGAPRAVLVAIGLVTATCLVVTPFMHSGWPLLAVIAVATVLGASSLGWNGVLLSEVATHAPEGLAVDATAGMQVVMFGGITVVPPLFGLLVMSTDSFTAAFISVAVLAVVGTVVLARMPRV
ncbi:MAG: MFS transporter [Gammaproteobacteria bacterium]|nr:MFS transporter [Gammaproteobacteria bacterium]NIM71654.1 MFS transporter [Gammaproteobacteria bacterium]NIO23398.1 MFS transporter [Gammaproteobacteria bacterium]NIO64019.1 MFS transporter [Gammaproteobacteria bacterium]NIP46128.1 MFS transporter [Gammaproteobacteria bacterium]